jgi:2-oxoglutarate ferredoxin oxidoreductase subunit beta
MTYLAKPKLHHPTLARNKVGFTRRDYEGAISTLCAGCGHDSISAAIVQACWELDIEPHRVAKLSGIGCSSKTPDYFLGNSHGFNSVHGRMPSVLTGANLANRELLYLGVSGDGDSASIGLGQFAHVMRRGVDMVYIVENNGVYGLTKGQFSATADQGSKSKRGVVNADAPIDMASLALQLGATYVARGFSGDKAQLVPLIKGAMEHRGAAFIDVISPCVAFNNHAGSTKSYDYVRAHNEAVNRIDFIDLRDEVIDSAEPGGTVDVPQGDGTVLRLRRIAEGYDATDRVGALNYIAQHQSRGELVTGLLYIEPDPEDLHAHLNTVETPFNRLTDADLVPGVAALAALNRSLRGSAAGRPAGRSGQAVRCLGVPSGGGSGCASRSRCASAGNHRIHSATTITVPTPPSTTAGTGPSQAASTPDSNSPIWLEAPTKTEFTAPTRPRIASGVSNCTRDIRITTLTMSDAPRTTSAANDRGSELDSPKTTVATPKDATAANSSGPTRRCSGRRDSHSAIASAPTAGAERSSPSPHGPVIRMSRA